MPKGGKNSRKKLPNVMLTSTDGKQQNEAIEDIRSPHMRIFEAKKILQGSCNPEEFKFRQKEINEIQLSLKKLMAVGKSKMCRILMLTGSPGTGKSLCANYVLRNSEYKVIYMNANSIKNKSEVQMILAKELIPKEKEIPTNLSTFSLIKRLQEQQIAPTILYIQEIQLFFSSSSVEHASEDFFDIFHQKNIPIVLLGISNTIDAVEKHGSKMNVNIYDIKNIVFHPYKLIEIVTIIEDKIKEIQRSTNIKLTFEGNLIKFTVNKLIQTRQSDMRYVFEFLKSLAKIVLPDNKHDLDVINITISEINKAMSQLKIDKNSLLESLPVSQQFILIAIYNDIQRYDRIFMTQQNLKDSLKQVYSRMSLNYDNSIHLQQQLSELQDNGFVQMKSKKNSAQKNRIFLKMSLDEIKYIYEEHPSFKKLILY